MRVDLWSTNATHITTRFFAVASAYALEKRLKKGKSIMGGDTLQFFSNVVGIADAAVLCSFSKNNYMLFSPFEIFR